MSYQWSNKDPRKFYLGVSERPFKKRLRKHIKEFKDTLKAFNVFKRKQKSVWKSVVWFVKVYIFWNCIQRTIHSGKTQMLKKFDSDKINGTKNCPVFLFCKLKFFPTLPLIYNSYMSWITRLASLKLCKGFFIFDSISILLKFIFFCNEILVLFDFKTP